jgi:hypothetical protein
LDLSEFKFRLEHMRISGHRKHLAKPERSSTEGNPEKRRFINSSISGREAA